MSKAENNRDYTELAAKDATELHKNFAAWIEEKTGFAPDLKTVQLAVTLRMSFQASPENQKHLAQRKAEAAAAKKRSAALKKAKLEAQLAKLKADLDKVETDEAAEEMPAETPAPAKKTVAAKPETAKAPARRRPATKKAAPANTQAVKNPPAPVGDDFDADDLEERPAPVKRARRPRATAAK
ncbi:hypothetical protein AB0911_31280 [Streptomyces nigra]|uniref:hypothetical protein n=1 Tax=Streptomyces nigra TaxID=1827580 RepID=UPI003452909B